jgi:hypothetical protein
MGEWFHAAAASIVEKVAADVEGNAPDPGAQVMNPGECGTRSPTTDERHLHCVLGIFPVAEHGVKSFQQRRSDVVEGGDEVIRGGSERFEKEGGF